MNTTNDTQAQRCAHTPGPWHLSHQLADGFSVAHEIAPNCGKLVCVATAHNVGGQPFHGFPLDDATAKANARLIASSPELLAELRILTGWVDANVSNPAAICLIGAARAAIAKATEGRA